MNPLWLSHFTATSSIGRGLDQTLVVLTHARVIGIELEGHCYSRLRSSEDFREGVEAFHAKRKPKFVGR